MAASQHVGTNVAISRELANRKNPRSNTGAVFCENFLVTDKKNRDISLFVVLVQEFLGIVHALEYQRVIPYPKGSRIDFERKIPLVSAFFESD